MEKTVEKSYLINWIGGKKNLRKKIAALIPQDIESYIEPFGGGAWVMFYKERWANLEVYNDLDNRLVNLFNCVKFHPDELLKELRYTFASRQQFINAMAVEGITDIQKAARFMYLITRSFGGKGCSFGTSLKGTTAMKSTSNILDRIPAIAKRLDKVVIENQTFKTLIPMYDYDEAFFFIDPPYSKGAGYITTSTKDFEHN